jgi:hypothetical protein
MYNNATNKDRVAPSTKQRDANLQKADRTAKGPNNVYADKSGNVHRQTSQGWQSRDQGQWQSSPRSSQATNMNRDYGARRSGATRAAPRGGGGGGRRR